MFVIDYDERKTINIQKVYLTNQKNKFSGRTLETYEDKNVYYTPEGKVEINGRCLDDNLEEKDCSETTDQSWIFNNGNLINKKSGLCLTEDHSKLSECPISGNFKYPTYVDNKFPQWQKKHGKSVVLVSSDNPWYINDQTTIKKPIHDYELKNRKHTNFVKDYAMFNPPNKVGLLKTQPEDGIEYFGNPKKIICKKLIFSMCILCVLFIILIISYRL